jgi:hypothetical protein
MRPADTETECRMEYRVVFDVADRVPDITLGAIALVLFAGLGVAALLNLDAVLVRWPLVLIAGAGLLALEAVVDRQLLVLGFCAFAFIIAAGSELQHRRMPEVGGTKGLPPGGGATMLGAFLLVFATFFGLPMISAIGLSQQLADGRAEVVEGPVTIDFEVGGGKNECIHVAARRFCYSDWILTPGFNRTRALGGPMENGLQVRVSSIGDTIVRVEAASGR